MGTLGVVLAAGQGKRLRPLTLTRSKPLLPVLGKPLVEWVLEMLYAGGVSRFLVVVNPSDTRLMEYLRLDSDFRETISLAFQEKPLGMADALRCARPFIKGDFILAACDNLVKPEHIRQLVLAKQEPGVNAVLSLCPMPRMQFNRLGAVVLEGEWVKKIVEKPGPKAAPSEIASLPIYAFSQALLNYLDQVPISPRGEYEIQDAIQMLIDHQGGVKGVFTAWRMDVTEPADLLEMNIHLLQRGYQVRLPDPKQVGGNTLVFPPVRVEEDVSIGEGCLIGPCVYLEKGTRVGNGSVIRWATVLSGAEIRDGETIIGEIRYPYPKILKGEETE
ncbi:MAG: hypothetical protein DRI61_08220 [Chloroflexi bacterium]|nr:MAG: hypothetical protein DRI61_08220 [Chloroflexota bacterium]